MKITDLNIIHIPINKIEDYQFRKNTKAYLKQKKETCPLGPEELARKVGYATITKFLKHRIQWHELERNIPQKYLEAIGVDLEILKYVTEIDREDFEEALDLPVSPGYFTVRYIPGIYGSKPLEAGITEEEAIEQVRDFSIRYHLECCINFPDLKTILIRPNGNISYSLYRPELKITKNWVEPCRNGREIGRMRIK